MAEGKITSALIDFALNTRFEDIPQEVLETQKKSLMDSIGVMSAASALEPACRPFMDFAEENSASKDCTIFGTGRRASALMAAMANGALIHALDYEDGHDASKTHPNTASTPAILALAESLGCSGRDALAAMAVSSEAAIRMKLALTVNDLFDCGWYAPPMFSAYGAVLGASRLLGLRREQTLDALSICLTQIMLPGQSAHSRQSALRGVREAFSAKAAVFSALMAQRGVPARMEEPIEGKYGLYAACFGGHYDPEVITGGLGERWECAKIRFKAWPCCGTSHAVLGALFTLMAENAVGKEEIRGVHLTINKAHMNLLEPREVKYRPGSLAAAKFSLPFSVALAVKYGRVALDLYNEAALSDPELLAIAESVTYEQRPVEEGRPASFYNDDHVKVTLKTARGDFEREVFDSMGSPTMPLSREQLRSKFFDCMEQASVRSGGEKAQKIMDAVLNFEKLASLKEFYSMF